MNEFEKQLARGKPTPAKKIKDEFGHYLNIDKKELEKDLQSLPVINKRDFNFSMRIEFAILAIPFVATDPKEIEEVFDTNQTIKLIKDLLNSYIQKLKKYSIDPTSEDLNDELINVANQFYFLYENKKVGYNHINLSKEETIKDSDYKTTSHYTYSSEGRLYWNYVAFNYGTLAAITRLFEITKSNYESKLKHEEKIIDNTYDPNELLEKYKEISRKIRNKEFPEDFRILKEFIEDQLQSIKLQSKYESKLNNTTEYNTRIFKSVKCYHLFKHLMESVKEDTDMADISFIIRSMTNDELMYKVPQKEILDMISKETKYVIGKLKTLNYISGRHRNTIYNNAKQKFNI